MIELINRLLDKDIGQLMNTFNQMVEQYYFGFVENIHVI